MHGGGALRRNPRPAGHSLSLDLPAWAYLIFEVIIVRKTLDFPDAGC
jgi:hypothetical protein